MEDFIVKYWVEWLMGFVASGLLLLYKRLSSRLKKESEENAALKQGIKALLRDRMIQQYNHYYCEKGWWPIYARDSMLDMYKQYKSLGGNGVVTDLIEDLKNLPTKEPNKKED